jgi:hypothetical protein
MPSDAAFYVVLVIQVLILVAMLLQIFYVHDEFYQFKKYCVNAQNEFTPLKNITTTVTTNNTDIPNIIFPD